MTHHAYIIEAGKSVAVQKSACVTVFGTDTVETSEFSFDTLGIDEARVIAELSSQNAWQEKRALFIYANFITREAQNSLLKILEEPLGGTVFFLVVPAKAELLPTVLSRLLPLSSEHIKGALALDPKKFIEASKPKRLAMISEFLNTLATEERSRIESIQFLEALEMILHSLQKTEMLVHLKELEAVRSYLYDRAPSQKMLLEHVALFLPMLKV